MNTNSHSYKSRAPRGADAKIHVYFRLTAEEKEELEAVAAKEDRSCSYMARILYLNGIKQFQAE